MMGDQAHLQTKEMSVRSEETSTSKSTITINNRRFVKNNPNRTQGSEIKTNADLKQQPDNVYVEQLSARKSKVTEDTHVEINFRTSINMDPHKTVDRKRGHTGQLLNRRKEETATPRRSHHPITTNYLNKPKTTSKPYEGCNNTLNTSPADSRLVMTDGPRRPKGIQMVQVKGSLRAGRPAPDLHSSKTACHLTQDCADDEGGLSSSKEDPIYETKDKENNARQRKQHCARFASAILRPGAHSKTKDIEQTVRTADAEWTDLSTHQFQSDEQSTSINTALKPSDATVAASYRKTEKPVKEEHCLYSLSQYVYHGTSSQQKSGEPTVCRYCIPAAHSRADHRKFHNGNAQNCAKTIRRGSTKATMTCAVDGMRCLDSMSEENNLDVIITSEIGSTGELEPKQSGSGTEGERIPPNRNGFLFSSIKKVDMSFDHDGTTERSVTDSKMSIAFQQCSLADTVSTILDYPLDVTTTLQTDATSQALQRELMSTSPKTETTSKMLQTKTTSNTHQTEVTSETYRTETSSKILKAEANSKTHQTGAVSATLETKAMSETQQTEATPTTLQTEAMWETHQTEAMSETQQTESTSKMLQTEVMSKAHQAEAMSKIQQTVVATKTLQTETASTLAGQRCNVTALLEEGGSKKDNREEADNAAGSTWFVFFEKPTMVRDISSSLLPGEPADKAEFKTNADNKQSSMSLERRQYYDVEGHSMLLNSTGDCSEPSPVNYENLRHLHDVLARKPNHEFYTDCEKSASLRHIEAATVDVIILNPSSAIPRSQLVFWEIWRLSTFSALEDLAVFAIRLAQTGFYYDEELDEIRCFSCNVSKRRWSKTEYPALVHLVLSPECGQANMRDRRNVPISEESQVLLPTTEGSADSGKGADVLQQDSDQTDASASTQSMPSAAVDPTSAERRNLQNDSKERAVSAGQAAARGTNADVRPSEPISTTAGRLPSLPQSSAQNQTLPTQNSLVGLPSGSVASSPQVKTASPSAGPPSQNSTTSSAPTVSKPLGAGEQSPSRYPVQVEQAPYATPNQHCHSHGSFEDSGVQEDNQETADGDGRPATGGLDMRRAINPAYATVSKRMATFSDWPSTGKPSSRVLVLAGFHYTGWWARLLAVVVLVVVVVVVVVSSKY